MKRSSILMTLCLLLMLSAGLHLWQKFRVATAKKAGVNNSKVFSSRTSPKAFAPALTNSSPTAMAATAASTATASLQNRIEDSLNNMTATLYAFAQGHNDINSLLEYLKSSHQDPFVVDDSNDVTGTMTIVRTNSPLPGTRYFHAQYFEDENRQKFVQHMSFEFKPGVHAMEEAMASVEKSFTHLGQPSTRKADFVQWTLPDGYVLWIKKLNARDLADNPFNAYSRGDVGTIRIAVEQNPEEGHSHGG
jgi:hypothetical protein